MFFYLVLKMLIMGEELLPFPETFFSLHLFQHGIHPLNYQYVLIISISMLIVGDILFIHWLILL